MRVLAWITETTWETCVDAARGIAGAGDDVVLLHVAPPDAEALATGGRHGLLGRHHPPPPGPGLEAISDEAAADLLAAAAERLGRASETVARRGRVEREVVAVAAEADLLVLVRDGDPRRPGPHSLGPVGRFVVDHATCAVLIAPAPPR